MEAENQSELLGGKGVGGLDRQTPQLQDALRSQVRGGSKLFCSLQVRGCLPELLEGGAPRQRGAAREVLGASIPTPVCTVTP